ncbi:MAG: hypothetical protein ACJARG_001613, partial [Arcticibacterium sp.]
FGILLHYVAIINMIKFGANVPRKSRNISLKREYVMLDFVEFNEAAYPRLICDLKKLEIAKNI